MRRQTWWLLLTLTMALAACTSSASALPAVSPTLPVPPVTPAPPATALAPAVPTATAPSSPTPSSTSPSPTALSSAQPCVPPRAASAPPPALTFNAALQGAVLQALNSGMRAEALNQILQRAGIGNYPWAAISADVNGDGRLDVVVSLADPNSRSRPPQGVLLVFLCQQGAFAQAATFTEPESQQMAWGAPVIQFAQDLNADGRAEIVISAAHCDATGAACVERYAILAWRKGRLQDLLQDGDRAFTSSVPMVEDPDGDGIYDFIIVTGDGQRLVWHYRGDGWQR